MGFAILKGEGPIREKIRELFTSSTRSRRRVILGPLAALVPLGLFPDVRDVEIFAWDQENFPDTAPLASLAKKGVRITWVNPMHLRLYWVKGQGVVIGPGLRASNPPTAFDREDRSDLALYLDAGALTAVDEVLGPLMLDPTGCNTFSDLQESCNLLWRLAEGITAAEPLGTSRTSPAALPANFLGPVAPILASNSLAALESSWKASARTRWYSFLAEEAQGPEGLLCFYDRPRTLRVELCRSFFGRWFT